MRQITATGQTVDEAVESALAQLKTTKDRTEIDVIDEGKKGIFGLFGTRPAVVKVTVKIDAVEETVKYLKSVGEQLGAPVDVEVKREGKTVLFTLTGEKIALLIGKRGQTLNSLQFLTQLVMNRFAEQYTTVVLDAEEYRKRRNDTLVQLAERLAQKAVRTGQIVALEPMPSYERKVIHTALMSNKKIKTYSDGTEPHRHIVIAPSK